MSIIFKQFKGLFWKNWIRFRRNVFGTLCEIFFPIVILFLLVWIRSLTDDSKNYAYQSYVGKPLENNKKYPVPLPVAPFNLEGTLNSCHWIKDKVPKIVLIPEDDQTKNLAIQINQYIPEKLKTKIQNVVEFYPSFKEFEAYVGHLDYKQDVCAGIEFQKVDGNTYEYSILYNQTQYVEKLNRRKGYQEIDKQAVELIKLNIVDQVNFFNIQQFVDNYIFRNLDGSDQKNTIIPVVTSIPVKEHNVNNLSGFQGFIGFLVTLPLIVGYIRLGVGMLEEKDFRLLEGMKIMGLKHTALVMSWVVWCLLSGVTYFGFMWMQNFITPDLFEGARLFTSIISPPTAFDAIIKELVIAEGRGYALTREDIFQVDDHWSIFIALCCMGGQAIVYFILSLYIDQVFPKPYQNTQPWNFLCQRRAKSGGSKSNQVQVQDNNNPNMEPVEKKYSELIQQNKVISIENLSKVYPNGKKAVDGLNMIMYDSQLFVLLGHNGAGKTSTLQMMSGFQDISQGRAIAYGFDVGKDQQQLRQITGFCPQHDVLYPELTVKEHLQLFESFKEVKFNNDQERQKAIGNSIKDVDLVDKTHVQSRALSGGMKRRLSVAIAFFGNSKIVYLDEPTSGMDTSARRSVWEVLNKYKNDRIIILTTHFMDEADYLGDRIGIMSDGKLVCCGSAGFLKNKFGDGYNLVIVKNNPDVPNQPYYDLIGKHIPDYKILSEVSQEIQVQINLKHADKFSALFFELDQSKEQLQMENYAISITTLEEVFIKVGHTGPIDQQDMDTSKKIVKENQVKPKPKKSGISNNDIRQERIQVDNNDINKKIINFNIFEDKVQSKTHHLWMQFHALIVKRLIFAFRDWKALLTEIFVPILMISLASFLINRGQERAATKGKTAEIYIPDLYWKPLQTNIGYETKFDDKLKKQLQKNDILKVHLKKESIKKWDERTYDQKGDKDLLSAFYVKTTDLINNKFSYTLELDSRARNIGQASMNAMNQAYMRYILNKDDISIKLTSKPMPDTQWQDAISESNSAGGILFFYAFAYALVTSSLVSYIIMERNQLIKHQQLVSGTSLVPYWISMWIIDILKGLILFGVGVFVVFLLDVKTFMEGTEEKTAFILLILLYTIAMIPNSYVFSFIFKSQGGAYVGLLFINFILAYMLTILSFFAEWLLRENYQWISDSIKYGKWVLRLLPSFAFCEGLFNMILMPFVEILDKKDYGPLDIQIAGGPIIMLAVSAIFYMTSLIVVEKLLLTNFFNNLISQKDVSDKEQIKLDNDVVEEQNRIDNMSQNNQDVVVVNKLRKVFKQPGLPPKIAVHNVSFGIPQGQVFTLLGVNGAGKTTTFKVLSGEIRPTSGSAYIKGFPVNTEIEQARKYIGYCPQFDALLYHLTAKEHLQLYARIKGIPGKLIPQMVQNKLVEMDLKKYENVAAGTYSGGNKRKLSVAIAMIGNPSIVFLDEPSTGMDPVARRFMWGVISSISTVQKLSSILLTTHSMEEAEALSNRIAIQNAGRLECVGTKQRIKQKFGQGYEIEIKVITPHTHELENYVNTLNNPIDINSLYDKNQVTDLYKKMGTKPEVSEEISAQGSGKDIFQILERGDKIKGSQLVEFFIITQQLNSIKDFVVQHLKTYEVIEQFGGLLRLQIEKIDSIGKIFQVFQQNKERLNIAHYSVKQATIEQIFNRFADGTIGYAAQVRNRQLSRQGSSLKRRESLGSRRNSDEIRD